MIYIYGDSHASSSFKNIPLHHKNLYTSSITMFRIGRDGFIINFTDRDHDANSILCFVYGEIDCRCHVHKQVLLGKHEDEIIEQLVDSYFKTIERNVNLYKKIIVMGVIPPTKKDDYEKLHGPIRHEFPFCGDDNDRVRYTLKMNNLIKEYCARHDYLYFNPYSYYTRDDGTLKFEMSDQTVHIGNNSFVLEEFLKLYEKL